MRLVAGIDMIFKRFVQRLPRLASVWAMLAGLLAPQRLAGPSAAQAGEQADELGAVLAALIVATPAVIFVKDTQGRFLVFNAEAERASGLAAAEVIGLVRPAFALPLQPWLLNADAAVLAADRRLVTEARLSTMAGERSFLLKQGPLRDAQGQVIGLYFVGLDVTSQREAEQLAERERDAFQHALLAVPERMLAHERQTTWRVAQTVHDHLGHALAVARLHLDMAESNSADGLPWDLPGTLLKISAQLDEAIRCVRSVLLALRPPRLEDEGLPAAIQYDMSLRDTGAPGPMVRFDAAPDCTGRRWSSLVEHAAFMVAREAVVNALKHANASRVRVSLAGGSTWLKLSVTDDGIGISANFTRGAPGHLGITGMAERADAIGGRLAVTRLHPSGTQVCLAWGGAI
jgi:PAS domain S-box-containing protein